MLLAQERLGFVMDLAAGTGNLKKHGQRQHMRDLQRMAGRTARRAAPDPFTRSSAPQAPSDPPQDKVDLADFGIEVVITDEKAGPGWPTVVEPSDG